MKNQHLDVNHVLQIMPAAEPLWAVYDFKVEGEDNKGKRILMERCHYIGLIEAKSFWRPNDRTLPWKASDEKGLPVSRYICGMAFTEEGYQPAENTSNFLGYARSEKDARRLYLDGSTYPAAVEIDTP